MKKISKKLISMILTMLLVLTLFPTIALAAPPIAPSNLVVTVDSRGVVLTWKDNATDEDCYRIGRVEGNSASGKDLGMLPANSTTFTDTTAQAGKTYRYSVIVEKADGSYDSCSSDRITLLATTPSTPTNLTGVLVTVTGGVQLSWTDNSNFEDGFVVLRQHDSASGSTTLATLPLNTTSYTDTTALEEETYKYCVRASGGGGFSALSNTVSIKRPMSAPINMWAASGTNGIKLGWYDNSKIEDSFAIFRKEGSGAFVHINSTIANSTTYTDTTAQAGKTYTYRVSVSKHGVEESTDHYSKEVTVTMSATTAPTITGPTAMTLAAGYTATTTGAYTINGTPAPTATKESGNAAITWDNANKKFNIAAGLAAGTYPVVLKATNGVNPDATLTFTLTVAAGGAPTITGPTTMTLAPGYTAITTEAYTINGTPAPTATKESGNAAITWDNANKRFNIAAGLAAGTYPVVLKAINGVNPDATLTFTLTVAASSTGMSNFTKVNTYTRGQFTDVNETLWYGYDQQKVIATAYEYGLMLGTSNTLFDPTGNVTIAQAITMASRVHKIYSTGNGDFVQDSVWYQVYVDYAIANNIIAANDFANYNKAATRAEMAYIFSKALPATEFALQNTVNSLPDVNNGTPYYSAILTLYKAGVLAGSDTQGTFNPSNNITRAEAAAIISRVILPTTRFSGKTF